MSLLSPAQLAGYLALVLGVAAFLQRDDRRLKLLVSAECVVYVFHFTLLHRPPAATSALVSAARNVASVWIRSVWLAAASVALNLALAISLHTQGAGWIPVVGSCLGSIAVFTLQGVPMRLVLLSSTALWLLNNVLAGSVGGTVLESLIAAASLTTIIRMMREERGFLAAVAGSQAEEEDVTAGA